VSQEGDSLFKKETFGRFNFEAHIMKAGKNNVQPFQEFLLGRGVDYDVIEVAEANTPQVVP